MKISRVEVLCANRAVYAKVYTDNGLYGIGESGAWGLLAASGEAIKMFGEYLVGQDPLDIEHHWQYMYRFSHFRGAAVMGAISALDEALYDIAGKFYGVPVYRLLGGKCRDKVRVYNHTAGRTEEELIENAIKGKEEAIAALPVSLACMLIGSLAMAGALTATGAGDVIGGFLSNVVGGMNNAYALGAVFFLLPFILTQFMQNQAVMAMFVPICLMACRNLNANPLGFMVLITAGSLTAFMTPMATSCIPAVMGAGGYDIKSLVKQGILPSAIFAVIYIFYTMTVMPV